MYVRRIVGILLLTASAIVWMVAAGTARMPEAQDLDMPTTIEYFSRLESGRSTFGVWFREAKVALPDISLPSFGNEQPNLFEHFEDDGERQPATAPVWLFAVASTLLGAAGLIVLFALGRKSHG